MLFPPMVDLQNQNGYLLVPNITDDPIIAGLMFPEALVLLAFQGLSKAALIIEQSRSSKCKSNSFFAHFYQAWDPAFPLCW